jgi:predicted HTH domain antitoxin
MIRTDELSLASSRVCLPFGRSARAKLETMESAEVTVSVALPSAALARETPDAIQRRLRLLWALDEIRAGRLTRVLAARWLGLSLDDFLASADEHGLAAFDYDADDFRSELASLT